MSQIKINTGAIENAASDITTINNQILDTLARSRAQVQSLSSSWSGPAAEATISAFLAFETKYSQKYRGMLNDYSNFLKNVAAGNYKDNEEKGTQLADTM